MPEKLITARGPLARRVSWPERLPRPNQGLLAVADATKCPLQHELVQQFAQTAGGGQAQLRLQAAAIEGGAGMEEGVAGVAPASEFLDDLG